MTLTVLPSQPALESKQCFNLHFTIWRILGILPTKNYRNLYIVYSFVINVAITIGCPLHLMIGLFESRTKFDLIKNVGINLVCLLCSIKVLVFWLKFENVHQIMEIGGRQDQRISQAVDESHYYKTVVIPSMNNIMLLFKVLYVSVDLASEAAVLASGFFGIWLLMFPAYFPFDPFANKWLYGVAHCYQLIGVYFQSLQGLANNTFLGMHLALLSGQLHCLNMRLSKIGYDGKKSKKENNRELVECIQDHRDLMQYRSKLEEVISKYMLFEILFISLNMCVTVVFLILYARDLFTIIYYTLYLFCMPVQILPACYYGTALEVEFQNLTYALFSMNWIDQDIKFKRNLRIFAEQTKKPLYITAWLMRINLDSFLYTCKNAYSLFAVVMNMKV